MDADDILINPVLPPWPPEPITLRDGEKVKIVGNQGPSTDLPPVAPVSEAEVRERLTTLVEGDVKARPGNQRKAIRKWLSAERGTNPADYPATIRLVGLLWSDGHYREVSG